MPCRCCQAACRDSCARRSSSSWSQRSVGRDGPPSNFRAQRRDISGPRRGSLAWREFGPRRFARGLVVAKFGRRRTCLRWRPVPPSSIALSTSRRWRPGPDRRLISFLGCVRGSRRNPRRRTGPFSRRRGGSSWFCRRRRRRWGCVPFVPPRFRARALKQIMHGVAEFHLVLGGSDRSRSSRGADLVFPAADATGSTIFFGQRQGGARPVMAVSRTSIASASDKRLIGAIGDLVELAAMKNGRRAIAVRFFSQPTPAIRRDPPAAWPRRVAVSIRPIRTRRAPADFPASACDALSDRDKASFKD